MTATYEKHTPTTDALDTLGSIITENEKRDAIHLAVENVIAGERLSPGEHVVLEDDGRAYATVANGGVGIVDPFIVGPVKQGQRFWLVVYPRQIHSLRHVWEHPAFPPSGETDVVGGGLTRTQQEAERWLRDYCRNENFDFDALIKATTEGGRVQYGDANDDYFSFELDVDYLHVSGTDAHGGVPSELYNKIETLTGKHVVARPSSFSCSC